MIKKIIFIVIPIILITITIVLLGTYGNSDELFPDTNVNSIDLNKEITLGDEVYTITSIDIGDTYCVVKFDHGLITGMELYQNDKELEYISARRTSYAGSAIAFAPAESSDGIEIRIYKVKRKKDISYTYPLVFDGATAVVEDTIDGVEGRIEIIREEKTFSLEFFGSINDILRADVNGFPKRPGGHVFLRDGENVMNTDKGSFLDNPPDEIMVYSTILELDEEQIVISVN